MNISEPVPWSECYPYVRTAGPLHGEARVLDAVTALYERAAYVADPATLPYFIADASSRRTVAALARTFFMPSGSVFRWFAQTETDSEESACRPIGMAWDTALFQASCRWYGWYRRVYPSRGTVTPGEDEDGVYISPIVYAPTASTTASTDPRIGATQPQQYVFVPGDCWFDWSAGCATIRRTSGWLSLDHWNRWCIAYNDRAEVEDYDDSIQVRWSTAASFPDANQIAYQPVKLADHYSGDSDATFIPDRTEPFRHAAVDRYFLERIKNRVALLERPYYVNHVDAGGPAYYASIEEFTALARPGTLGYTGGLLADDGKYYAGLLISYSKLSGGKGHTTWQDYLSSVSEGDLFRKTGINAYGRYECHLNCSVYVDNYHWEPNDYTASAHLECDIYRPILLYKPLLPFDDRILENGVFGGCDILASIAEAAPLQLTKLFYSQSLYANIEKTQPSVFSLLNAAQSLAHPDYQNFVSNRAFWSSTAAPNPVVSFGGAVMGEGVGEVVNFLTRLGRAEASETRPVIVYTPPLSTADILPKLKTAAMYGALTFNKRDYDGGPVNLNYTRSHAVASALMRYDVRSIVERHEPPMWKHTL